MEPGLVQFHHKGREQGSNPSTCYHVGRMIFVFLDLVRIDLVAGLILVSAMCSALIAGISFHEF